METRSQREALTKIAESQHGLFTRAQAVGCGYSQYQIRRKREVGDWRTVLGSVYTLAGTPDAPRLRDAAAALAAPGAVLAGPSAARWHDIDVHSTATYVMIEPKRQLNLDGVCVIRDRPDPADVVLRDEIYMTGVNRTVLDCMRVLPDGAAAALLEQALQEGLITMDDLARRIGGFAGRHGAPRLVRLVGQAASTLRSAAERRAGALLRSAGIWGWLAAEPISDRWGLIAVGDVVFPRPRLIVELDGPPGEPDPKRLQIGRERQNRLVAAGWTVLRFTWDDLDTRDDYFVSTVRAMLMRLGANGTGR